MVKLCGTSTSGIGIFSALVPVLLYSLVTTISSTEVLCATAGIEAMEAMDAISNPVLNLKGMSLSLRY
jgi:hypothetical protein